MRSTDEDFFWQGDVEDTKARVLVAQFDGVFDVGGVARLAVEEMLRSLLTKRVVAFGTDTSLDYRFHRPFAMVSDWVFESVGVPELVLGRIKGDLGNPVLVLHGAGPDMKWESFLRIIIRLTARAGVEIAVSSNGTPSGVPCMRPMSVRVQATEKTLTPEQPRMTAILHFPTPMTTFLQERLANRGIPGIVFLAAIPFYVADAAYPVGASVLLSALSDLADLPLPVSELEQDVAEEHTAIERILESNSEMQHAVAALKEYFDVLSGAGKDDVPSGEWVGHTPLRSERKTEKSTGDVIEAYLVNLAEQPEKNGVEEAQAEEKSDPLQAALRRTGSRRLNPNAPRNVGRPRHSTQPESNEPAASSGAGLSAQGESASGEQSLDEESSHRFF